MLFVANAARDKSHKCL